MANKPHKDSLTPLGGDLHNRIRAARVSPLAVAVFLVVATIMGIFTWISLAGDPEGGEPRVMIALPPDFSGPADSVPEPLMAMTSPDAAIAPEPTAKPEQPPLTQGKARKDDPSPWTDASDLARLRDTQKKTPPAPLVTATASETGMAGPEAPAPALPAETHTDTPPASPTGPSLTSEPPAKPTLDLALVEEGPYGPLPVIAEDGRQPLEAYARPFVQEDPRPRLSILIRGLGLSTKTTRTAIDTLPPEITLSFVPYSKNLQAWVDQARAAGHEVMLELPMEPYDYPNNDSGPYTLLTDLSRDDNMDRLNWLLSRFTGYIGVTNYLGAKFTANRQAFVPVLKTLAARGLLYVDDGTADRELMPEIASESGLVWTTSARNLTFASAASIDADLIGLEGDARAQGAALATGFSFPITLQRVREWAATLEDKGFVLAPVSAVVARPPQS